ncbi:MAG: ATP-binding protein [Candidatus Omnitrophota bacterium]
MDEHYAVIQHNEAIISLFADINKIKDKNKRASVFEQFRAIYKERKLFDNPESEVKATLENLFQQIGLPAALTQIPHILYEPLLKLGCDRETLKTIRSLVNSMNASEQLQNQLADSKNKLHEQIVLFLAANYAPEDATLPSKSEILAQLLRASRNSSKENADEYYKSFMSNLGIFSKAVDVYQKASRLKADVEMSESDRIFHRLGQVCATVLSSLKKGVIDEVNVKRLLEALAEIEAISLVAQFKSRLSNDILAGILEEFNLKGDEELIARLKQYAAYNPRFNWVDHRKRNIFELINLFLQAGGVIQSTDDAEVYKLILTALLKEIEGSFVQWKYESSDLEKTLAEVLNLESLKLSAEEQGRLQEALSNTEGESILDKLQDLEGFQGIKDRIEQISKNWKQTVRYSTEIDGEEFNVEFLDDFYLMFNIGNSQHWSACQGCAYGSGLNRGLTGYTLNGTDKAIALLDKDDRVVTRRIVRLKVIEDFQGKKQAVIFVEENAQFGKKGLDKLYAALEIISMKMGIPVVTSGWSPGAGWEQAGSYSLLVYPGRSPFDYSDLFGSKVQGEGAEVISAGLYKHIGEKTAKITSLSVFEQVKSNLSEPEIMKQYQLANEGAQDTGVIIADRKIEQVFDLRARLFSGKDSVNQIRKAEADNDIHMVKVINPSEAQAQELSKEGYFLKPSKIAYELDVPTGTVEQAMNEYYGRFKSKQRINYKGDVRKIKEALDRKELELVIDEGENPELFKGFLALYEKEMDSKARGRKPLIDAIRKAGGDPQAYLKNSRMGVYLKKEGKLVGGIILKKLGSGYSISYAATDSEIRQEVRSMQFFLMQHMIQLSNEKRYTKLGYGVDTNLYGHHLSTGLMQAKIKSGFKPRAANRGDTEMMKITTFGIFDMPMFFYTLGAKGELEATLIADNATKEDVKQFEDVPMLLNIYLLKDGKLIKTSKEELQNKKENVLVQNVDVADQTEEQALLQKSAAAGSPVAKEEREVEHALRDFINSDDLQDKIIYGFPDGAHKIVGDDYSYGGRNQWWRTNNSKFYDAKDQFLKSLPVEFPKSYKSGYKITEGREIIQSIDELFKNAYDAILSYYYNREPPEGYRGEIRVSLSIKVSAQDEQMLVITVTDNGLGKNSVSNEQKKESMFFRGQDNIGLGMVEKIIKDNGGIVDAKIYQKIEDAVDVGARVRLEIPLKRLVLKNKDAKATSSPAGAGATSSLETDKGFTLELPLDDKVGNEIVKDAFSRYPNVKQAPAIFSGPESSEEERQVISILRSIRDTLNNRKELTDEQLGALKAIWVYFTGANASLFKYPILPEKSLTRFARLIDNLEKQCWIELIGKDPKALQVYRTLQDRDCLVLSQIIEPGLFDRLKQIDQKLEIDEQEEKEIFEIGGRENLLAHGISSEKKGLRSLINIILEGEILANVGEGYVGQLINGDSGIFAGSHGPYYVVLKKGLNGSLTSHDEFQWYLIPNKEIKQEVARVLELAYIQGKMKESLLKSELPKLITYRDFIDVYNKGKAAGSPVADNEVSATVLAQEFNFGRLINQNNPIDDNEWIGIYLEVEFWLGSLERWQKNGDALRECGDNKKKIENLRITIKEGGDLSAVRQEVNNLGPEERKGRIIERRNMDQEIVKNKLRDFGWDIETNGAIVKPTAYGSPITTLDKVSGIATEVSVRFDPKVANQCVPASRLISVELNKLGIRNEEREIHIPYDASKDVQRGDSATSHTVLEAVFDGEAWVIDTQLLQFTLPDRNKLRVPEGFVSERVYRAEDYYKKVLAFADSICMERITKAEITASSPVKSASFLVGSEVVRGESRKFGPGSVLQEQEKVGLIGSNRVGDYKFNLVYEGEKGYLVKVHDKTGMAAEMRFKLYNLADGSKGIFGENVFVHQKHQGGMYSNILKAIIEIGEKDSRSITNITEITGVINNLETLQSLYGVIIGSRSLEESEEVKRLSNSEEKNYYEHTEPLLKIFKKAIIEEIKSGRNFKEILPNTLLARARSGGGFSENVRLELDEQRPGEVILKSNRPVQSVGLATDNKQRSSSPAQITRVQEEVVYYKQLKENGPLVFENNTWFLNETWSNHDYDIVPRSLTSIDLETLDTLENELGRINAIFTRFDLSKVNSFGALYAYMRWRLLPKRYGIKSEAAIKTLANIIEQARDGKEINVAFMDPLLTQILDKAKDLVEADKSASSPVVLENSVSSPVKKELGGIDMRSLSKNTVIQPMAGASPVRGISLQGQSLNLDKEWQEIERMANSGIAPSCERLREYLLSLQDPNSQIDKVLACIADILRQEEEKACYTESSLREILVLLESDKPVNELRLALAKVQVLAKEPQLIVQ